MREAICNAAVRAVRAVGYVGAGTLEFIADASEGLCEDRIWFMEMNTRLQVEHPVTESVTGIDLVREQIMLAQGQPLSLKQEDVRLSGVAIECRINAEDPVTFAPAPGQITAYSAPGGLGVRLDSAVYQGYSVLPYYDSLVAKLIVTAENRETAIRRMQRALGEYVIQGIKTNIPFHRAALADEAFLTGMYDTRFVERLLASETGTHRLNKAIEETP
jgi:acetyl-CoA carboxylase biotin carboxylase subunit